MNLLNMEQQTLYQLYFNEMGFLEKLQLILEEIDMNM